MEYKFKRLITKKCGWCGKEFKTGRDNNLYCCDECKREKRKENSRNHAKKMKLLQEQEPVQEKKGMSELARINAKARAAGMSYGQYDLARRMGRVANG